MPIRKMICERRGDTGIYYKSINRLVIQYSLSGRILPGKKGKFKNGKMKKTHKCAESLIFFYPDVVLFHPADERIPCYP